MKKLILVLFAALLVMPLAAGCTKKQVADTTTVYDELKAAFLSDHVYFDFDRYEIRPDGAAICQAKAAFLSQYTGVRTEIQGHCDERGTEAYNLALGDRRAKATYNYMANLGISADRMTTVTYGFERPLDQGHNEAAWERNRRAQFILTAE